VNQLSPDLLNVVVPIAIVLLSLTVHEAAHAWTADRLGDPTARMLGRVTFNPIAHIDPIGTILLPLIAAMGNFPVIGWAKPVPVDIRRLRHPRRDFMLVAAAGPASNILQGIVAAIAYHVLPLDGISLLRLNWSRVVEHVTEINMLLAVFNLVPIPPLDGGNVLAGLLPPSAAEVFNKLRPFGFIILYALLLSGALNTFVFPLAEFLTRLLIP
jgi:Zn-dependent protease